MTVVAVCMAKDEADIIGASVAHMLTQVDRVIVADNGSTDGTRAILDQLDVDLLDDPDVAYLQSEKTTALAQIARSDHHADWIVPFDADEVWYSPFGRIADVLEGIEPQWLVAAARLYDHVATAQDPDDPDPVGRIGWRRPDPVPLPKVACRWRDDLTIEQGNHGARYDGGATIRDGLLVVRHFPYRSAEQFVRKARNGAAAYNATNLPPEVGAHWRQYGAIAEAHGDDACADIFRTWFWSADPEQDQLIFDTAYQSARR
jgi:glycosyltransferase involved in cell wall biosynthesis